MQARVMRAQAPQVERRILKQHAASCPQSEARQEFGKKGAVAK